MQKGVKMTKEKAYSILIVDDVEPVLYVFERFLNTQGYHTIVAHDGEEGFRLWEEYKPDLVITDIRMPKKTGFELANAIRAKNPNQKIILMSGFEDDIELLKQQEPYGFPYLAKPVDLYMVLGPLVKKVLEGKT